MNANEAYRIGLVNSVFPHESFMDNIIDYDMDLASSVSPRSMTIMKRQVVNALFQTLARAAETADEELLKSLTSKDFKEGVAHFLEKRPPRFTGR